MAEFISLCERFTLKVLSMGHTIVELITSNLYDAFYPYLPDWIVTIIPDGVIDTLNQYSMIDLMFGTGIILVIGISLIKFLKM